MNNKSKELEKILITIRETSERDLDELSDSIDKIIECHITNERTISLNFWYYIKYWIHRRWQENKSLSQTVKLLSKF